MIYPSSVFLRCIQDLQAQHLLRLLPHRPENDLKRGREER